MGHQLANDLGQGESSILLEDELERLELREQALQQHSDLRSLVGLASAVANDLRVARDQGYPASDWSVGVGHCRREERDDGGLLASSGSRVEILVQGIEGEPGVAWCERLKQVLGGVVASVFLPCSIKFDLFVPCASYIFKMPV